MLINGSNGKNIAGCRGEVFNGKGSNIGSGCRKTIIILVNPETGFI